MTQEEFLKEFEKNLSINFEIVKQKNADYSDQSDAYKNFKACESLGIPLEIGIIVRMTDKLVRATNLLNRKASVKDESIADTLTDLSNYAMILKIYIENKKDHHVTLR